MNLIKKLSVIQDYWPTSIASINPSLLSVIIGVGIIILFHLLKIHKQKHDASTIIKLTKNGAEYIMFDGKKWTVRNRDQTHKKLNENRGPKKNGPR